MDREKINNTDYLKLVAFQGSNLNERFLLPHEEIVIDGLYASKLLEIESIKQEKVNVTGGDDWHDGAFRATDNASVIVTESMGLLKPFLLAKVVDYPNDSEQRVSLGSRALITQRDFTFPVDIVGFRPAYPSVVIDSETEDEVTGITLESALGKAILGKMIGDEVTYRHGEREMNVRIVQVNQLAVAKYFSNSADLDISVAQPLTSIGETEGQNL